MHGEVWSENRMLLRLASGWGGVQRHVEAGEFSTEHCEEVMGSELPPGGDVLGGKDKSVMTGGCGAAR